MLGDFLFAQSSWFLANLNNLEVGLRSLTPRALLNAFPLLLSAGNFPSSFSLLHAVFVQDDYGFVPNPP
jgi:hypothetical protein